MWTYEQSTGKMLDPGGAVLAVGYSGGDDGKNNPAFEAEHDVGPLPQGVYLIGEPRDTVGHGPYALPLTPDAANQMFGRSDFLIHGDSITAPGSASEGCIIMPRFARERIWESGDRQLTVVATVADSTVVSDPDLGI
jgi:hypothetical protein